MKTLARWLRRILDKVDPVGPAEQWVVRFGNYEPAEIDSIWDTEEEANARLTEIERESGGYGSMWTVEEW